MADQGRTNRYGRPIPDGSAGGRRQAETSRDGQKPRRADGRSDARAGGRSDSQERRGGLQAWRSSRDGQATKDSSGSRQGERSASARQPDARRFDAGHAGAAGPASQRPRTQAAPGRGGNRRDETQQEYRRDERGTPRGGERAGAGSRHGAPAQGQRHQVGARDRSQDRGQAPVRQERSTGRPQAGAAQADAGFQPVVVRTRLHPMEYRMMQLGQVFDQVCTWEYPADAVLSHWLRAHPQVGARDRAQLAEAVYDVLRHLRRYRHYAESGTGTANRRLAILGLLATQGREVLEPVLNDEERAWLERLEGIEADSLPLAVRHSFPDWLSEQLAVLADVESLMASLNLPAGLDLRVNPMKADRDELLAALRKSMPQHDPQPTPYSPWGIRVQGRPSLQRTSQFEHGLLEVQDEGSQLLALLVGPKRGEMIIDFCAGAGGKTLLLGALMRSTGRLYAFDVSAARLARAKPRLARSGLSNVATIALEHENDVRVKRLAGKAQRVLVDAPCSGMGTLRRNPDMKWRQSPQSVRELCDVQARVLESAARCVAPGGRLVYATCSLLPQENEEQVQAFLKKHPAFQLLDAGAILEPRAPGLGMQDSYLRLRPDQHGTDGFFAAAMERRGDTA